MDLEARRRLALDVGADSADKEPRFVPCIVSVRLTHLESPVTAARMVPTK